MTQIVFKDLAIGKEFVFNQQTYIKINPEKISCCRSNTAALKDDPTKKIMINPGVIVEVSDES